MSEKLIHLLQNQLKIINAQNQLLKQYGYSADTIQTPSLENISTAPKSIINETDLKPLDFDFSLYFFGNYPAEYTASKYDLIFEAARFADDNGFKALWVPERHFHAFGGFSPNPSVMCAALAKATQRIKLRAGSVVIPLHNPIRVAEEWAMVDNISGGRVDGIGAAIGWHADDFVFNPDIYGRHPEILLKNLNDIQTLWRGETIKAINGTQKAIDVRLFPMPSSYTLPVWFTIVDNPETYAKAGAFGANVLTNLMSQDIEKLKNNIEIYRRERAKNGFADTGKVTLLLHTFILDNAEKAISIARKPFCDYLRTTINLFKNLAKAQGIDFNYDTLTEDDIQYYLTIVFEKYIQSSALIGSVDTCVPILDKLKSIGVDEIAFFVDFGILPENVIQSLPYINRLKEHKTVPPFEKTLSHKSTTPSPPLARGADCEAGGGFLTMAQKKLLNFAKLYPESELAYHVSVTLKFDQPLNMFNLNKAVEKLLLNHSILNIHFNAAYEMVFRNPSVQNALLQETLVYPKVVDNEELQRLIKQDSIMPFDLENGPLIRFTAVNLSPNHSAIILTAHHSIVDGWSMGLLIEEFSRYYFDPDAEILPRKTFTDYQKDLVKYHTEIEANNEYWIKKLKEFSSDHFSIAYKNCKNPASNAGKYRFTVNQTVLQDLKQQSSRLGCSLFILLLGAYQILLNKLSNQNKFVIHMVHSGRFNEENDDFIGFASQVIPIVAKVQLADTLKDLLNSVKNEFYEALEHQVYSFPEVCSHFHIDLNNFPFSNYLFNMERSWNQFIKENNIDIEINPLSKIDYDFAFNAVEFNQQLHFDCNYNKELFSEHEIAGMTHAYCALLEDVINHQGKSIADIKLTYLTQADYNKIVYEWNSQCHSIDGYTKNLWNGGDCLEERTDSDEGKCEGRMPVSDKQSSPFQRARAAYTIQRIFEEQVEKTPKHIAIVQGEKSLTYQALNQKANQLAHYLREVYHIQSNDLIALCLDQSEYWIIAILAVLKAGSGYVPLPLNAPDRRIQYMIEDTKAKAVLAGKTCQLSNKLQSVAGFTPLELIDETGFQEKIKNYPKTNPKHTATSQDLAYIIYTSGTTGAPKGVMIEHAQVASLLQNDIKTTEKDVVLQASTPAFDASVFEIYTALLNGAKLVLLENPLDLLNPLTLEACLKLHKVSILLLTKTLFDQIYDVSEHLFKNLNYLIVGGEALDYQSIYHLSCSKNKPLHLINAYGPTENTVLSCLYEIQSSAIEELNTIPIGKPFNNRTVYILDNNLVPLPIGRIGELYVGGAGIARGYLNQRELTEEKFIPNPFKTGNRLYKTGDLARWLPDGNIEYIGRNDFQVKLRGFRIELGEIENQLQSYPGVKQAIVIVQEQSSNKHLIGYYSAESPLDHALLLDYLSQKLPEYMVPSLLVYQKQWPISANGKLDRRALSKPERLNRESYLPPGSKIENELCQIFANILALDKDKISINESFFQLGGSSITLIKLLSCINSAYSVQLSMIEILANPTVQGVALMVQRQPSCTKLLLNTGGLQQPLITDVPQLVSGIQPADDVPRLVRGIQSVDPADKPRDVELCKPRDVELCKTQDVELRSKLQNIFIKSEADYPQHPLIFIHPGHAGAEVYHELIRQLSVNIPCYAIDSFNLYCQGNWLTTIEDMAKHYIHQLDQNNIRGPYQLAGWSLGGIIAVEMACQLTARGDRIQHVYLLDSILLDDQCRMLAKACHEELKNHLFMHTQHEFSERQKQVFEIENHAILDYQYPEKVDFNATLFKANILIEIPHSQQLHQYASLVHSFPDNGWSNVISNLEIIHQQANHFDLLKGESLNQIIQAIHKRRHQYAE